MIRWMSALVLGFWLCLQLTGCTAQLSQNNQASSMGQSLPFAYDAQADQIAYMSCSGLASSYSNSQFFTLRVGGYGPTAGLSLTSSVLTQLKAQLTTEQPTILADSAKNSNTQLVLATHPPGAYQSIDGSGNNTLGQDYSYALGSTALGTTALSQALIALTSGTKLRYISTGTLPGGRFEADVFYGTGDTLMGDMRTNFGNGDVLGLNYSESVGDAYPRGPYDFDTTQPPKTKSVWGRGYQLKFQQPIVSGGVNSSYPNYVLQSVYEMNMQTNAPAGTSWTCPQKLQLRIVRVEDLSGVFVTNTSGNTTVVDTLTSPNCSEIPDSQNTDQATLAIVRKSLRAEDWYVDLNDGCIIPKNNNNGSCYGTLSGLVVNYNQSAYCTGPTSTGSLDAGTNNFVGGTCEHYVSICTRN
jgi:hypothetical protein